MAERDSKVSVIIILITPAVIGIRQGLLAPETLYLPCVVEGVGAMCLTAIVDNDRQEEKRRKEYL